MKKCLVILGALLFAFAFTASDLMAFQEAFNVSGHRSQARNATTATIDAAYYNPVGLVNMAEGLYVDAGNRILSLTTTTEAGSLEAESSTMTYLLPNLAVAYRAGAGALFLTFDIREGGAGGTWDDADGMNVVGGALDQSLAGGALGALFAHPLLNGYDDLFTKIEMTTYTFGLTLGSAYRINEMVAVGGGLRYLRKTSEAKISVISGAETIANGFGSSLPEEYTVDQAGYAGFIAVMVTPMTGLNLSLQFQGKAVKYGKSELTTASGVSDEETSLSVSPGVLYFGAAYTAMPGLEIQFAYTREFTAAEKNGGDYDFFAKKDVDKQVFALGAEYRLDAMFLLGAGLSYKLTGTNDDNNNNPTDPAFNELDLGFGAVITAMPGLNVEVGFQWNVYSEMENGAGTLTHNRDAWVIGLGVTYKVM